jgi:RNA polymerase sigma factor (sigma-70 family)
VEVSALKPTAVPRLRGPTALLRLQSDERLIVLIRRGQHAAFEVLFSRYRTRLLAFCRHMLGSREDSEDVLQEVFAAAFNAILADEREINVRPWLYRIARNRSLNHLRRPTAIGVDSMDVHYADNGLSTAEKVMRRESFRQLIGDVRQLPETQRTALLLREIDALSYEQIAHAMETTIPAVKSLLVRARISLGEAAEARKLTCEQVRLELGEAAEGLVKTSAAVRRHVRDCERCRAFRKHLKHNNVALAAMLPVGPLLLLKKLALTKLGSTAGAGGAHVAGGASAAAGASAAGGATFSGSLLTAGTSALATKAVAGLAVAAIVTAGTVEAEHSASRSHHHRSAVAARTSQAPALAADEPVVTGSTSQPVTTALVSRSAATNPHKHRDRQVPPKARMALPKTSVKPAQPDATPAVVSNPALPNPRDAKTPTGPITQVTTETTQLPSTPQAAPTPAGQGATPRSTGPTSQAPVEAPPPATPATPASPPPPAPEGATASSPPQGGASPQEGAIHALTPEPATGSSTEASVPGSAAGPKGDGAAQGAPQSR